MKVEMEHNFPLICYDWDWLFRKFDNPEKAKLSTWKRRLVTQSKEDSNERRPNLYRGDGFEAFTEALMKIIGAFQPIGVYKYSPVPPEKDFGVDGFGVGKNGKDTAVQAKFRSDTSSKLKGKDLKGFVGKALATEEYDVPDEIPKDKRFRNIIIVTTAKRTDYTVENKVYENKVKTFGYKELKRLVDHNLCFWDQFKQLGDELIEKHSFSS